MRSLGQHRADLAGSLAARTNNRRYLEIIYGVLLGLLMWVVDAAMNVRLDIAAPSSAGFLDDLLRPGFIPTLFRGAYLIVAVALGWVLWRANLKREAYERQKHEQALAAERLRTMIAVVNTFNHDLKDPLAVIANSANRLAERAVSTNDQMKLDEIAQSASNMSSLITQLATSAPLYLVDAAGDERLVPREFFEVVKEDDGF